MLPLQTPLFLCYTDQLMRLRVTCHARGHTTWQASSHMDSLSFSFPSGHCNHGMRPATRSLHSHKSGVTPAVMWQSRGYPRPLRSFTVFALIGIFTFYSAFSVASSQQLVLLTLYISSIACTPKSPEGHTEVTQSQYYHKKASYLRRPSHFIKIQHSFFAVDHIVCLSFI